MKQLPPKLEAIRDKRFNGSNDSFFIPESGSWFSPDHCAKVGFDAGVQAILESEELRGLVETLKRIADNAARETNGLKEYRGDTYGFILKLAKQEIESWHKLIGEDEG